MSRAKRKNTQTTNTHKISAGKVAEEYHMGHQGV